MIRIGPKNDILHKTNYDEWPLFKEYRFTDQFKAAYKTLFGEEFGKTTDITEVMKQDIINKDECLIN
jgi:hypothetical protein